MPANMAADVAAAETQAEQVRLLMEGARTSLPASVAVATVAAYVQWPVIEHSVVAVWVGCIVDEDVLFALGLLALLLLVRRARGTPREPQHSAERQAASAECETGRRAQVPIVAVTAHVMRGEREALLQQGVDDYLGKPIARTTLFDCLARWLPVKSGNAGAVPAAWPSALPSTSAVLVDRGVLEQLLRDVGPENARAVVDAFLQELEKQADTLGQAAGAADLAGMAQAAHRLEGSAASFGAVQLSRVLASAEQAARSGNGEAAMAALRGCLGLAMDSGAAMAALREEIFSSAGEAMQA